MASAVPPDGSGSAAQGERPRSTWKRNTDARLHGTTAGRLSDGAAVGSSGLCAHNGIGGAKLGPDSATQQHRAMSRDNVQPTCSRSVQGPMPHLPLSAC
jgi:hypothetical protein